MKEEFFTQPPQILQDMGLVDFSEFGKEWKKIEKQVLKDRKKESCICKRKNCKRRIKWNTLWNTGKRK